MTSKWLVTFEPQELKMNSKSLRMLEMLTLKLGLKFGEGLTSDQKLGKN